MAQPVLFPRRRYYPPGVAGAIGLVLSLARQTALGAQLLNAEHILWGFLSLGGIFVGFLLADLSTASSTLRRWIRYRARLFDVLSVFPLYESSRNRDYLMVAFRFVVRLDGATAILRLKSPGEPIQHDTVIDLVPNLTQAEGSDLRLPIATFEYDRPDNTMLVWGDPALPRPRTILGGAVNCVATIEVQRKALFRKRQTFSIWVAKTNVTTGRYDRVIFKTEDDEFLSYQMTPTREDAGLDPPKAPDQSGGRPWTS